MKSEQLQKDTCPVCKKKLDKSFSCNDCKIVKSVLGFCTWNEIKTAKAIKKNKSDWKLS